MTWTLEIILLVLRLEIVSVFLFGNAATVMGPAACLPSDAWTVIFRKLECKCTGGHSTSNRKTLPTPNCFTGFTQIFLTPHKVEPVCVSLRLKFGGTDSIG